MLILIIFASSECFGLVDIGQKGDMVFFKNKTYVNAHFFKSDFFKYGYLMYIYSVDHRVSDDI
jgi:hypothetical protein